MRTTGLSIGLIRPFVGEGIHKRMAIKTQALIEQHFHGAYGVNFSNCSQDSVLFVAEKLKQEKGIGGIFPTLVTDSVENLRRQVQIIKSAAIKTTGKMAKILGIHLEGNFINPAKKGIHNPELFLDASVDAYKLIEDDFIKIVTLAPERCRDFAQKTNQQNLMDYLHSRGVKVQAGHCVTSDLSGCDGVTHLFNAMSPISHHPKDEATALAALTDDNLYTEIIADGVHLSDRTLQLIMRAKPTDKLLFVADSLPVAGLRREECTSFEFAGKQIFYNGEKAIDKNATLAGSVKLLPDIIETFASKKIATDSQIEEIIYNSYKYHHVNEELGEITWSNNWQLQSV